MYLLLGVFDAGVGEQLGAADVRFHGSRRRRARVHRK